MYIGMPVKGGISNWPTKFIYSAFSMILFQIDIPAFHTRYYCELKKVPKFDVKHHMIKVKTTY